jgi:Ca-activated chloride channel family protein
MNTSKFDPEDPRLTAYALGEMDAAERAEFEQWLQLQPEAQKAVEEIRATAALLGTALADEPELASAGEITNAAQKPLAAAAIIPGKDWRVLDGGPAPAQPVDEYRKKHSKLLSFPALYYMTASLAAACFAVIFFTSAEYRAKEQKRYIEMNEAMASGMRDASAKRETAAREAEAVAQTRVQRREPAVVFALPPVADPLPAATAASAPAPAAVPPIFPPAPDGSTRVTAPQLAAAASTPSPSDRDDKLLLHQFAVTAATAKPAAAARIAGESHYGTTLAATGDATWRVGAPPAPPPPVVREQRYISTRAPLPQTEPASTESYAHTAENPFLTVAQNPLSTFSVDVDTASYANVRRFLRGKRLPPSAAVRIEELVNYFPYRYAPPSDSAPFAAHMEVASAPWAPDHRLVRIGLKGREVSDAARPAANLVFLFDVSGSMNQPNKLPLVQQSLRMLVEKLRADDRVAIVVYAGASGMALPSTPVREKAKILGAIDALRADGSTNGAAGIQLAYDIAKANFISGGVNRVVLATDGDFNVGVSSEGELTALIEEKAKSHVFLSVLGFGMGNYKDSTLEQLADKGNGNYAYIDTLAEAKKTLVEQAGSTLVTIAKDVKLQVEFNPAIAQAYRLIGYENRMLRKEDFNNDKIDAGEIGAGHTVTALYEVIPVGVPLPDANSVDALKYQKTVETRPTADVLASRELLTLKVRYKEPTGDVSAKLEFPLRDTGKAFADASADFKFAAAVASFGMTLKNSPFRGEVKFTEIAQWAREGTSDDAGGYRAEFVELVNEAATLMEN